MKVFILSAFIFALGLIFAPVAQAVCPVCTVAVGAGLGLSRFLGIDDLITGVWIGGLMISLTLWTADWLHRKNWKLIKGIRSITLKNISFLLWILLTYFPLWLSGVIGHPFNTVFGIDKFVFGSVAGAAAFVLAVWADKKVRKVRGRQLFTYQKIIFPVLSLLTFSLVLYFWGGYLK